MNPSNTTTNTKSLGALCVASLVLASYYIFVYLPRFYLSIGRMDTRTLAPTDARAFLPYLAVLLLLLLLPSLLVMVVVWRSLRGLPYVREKSGHVWGACVMVLLGASVLAAVGWALRVGITVMSGSVAVFIRDYKNLFLLNNYLGLYIISILLTAMAQVASGRQQGSVGALLSLIGVGIIFLPGQHVLPFYIRPSEYLGRVGLMVLPQLLANVFLVPWVQENRKRGAWLALLLFGWYAAVLIFQQTMAHA